MWRWIARRRLDEETRDELRAHFELLTERYVGSGMEPEEARAAARRQLGNVTLVREEIHVMNGISWIDGVKQDLRYALRQLRANPGFAAVVVATLGLGIGGITAVFTVMHALLIEPLPFAKAAQLVRIYQEEPGAPSTRRLMSAPQFRMLREESTSLASVGARYVRDDLGLDLTGGGPPQRLRVLAVTSDYFRTLRAEPVLGQGFSPADETAAADRQHSIGALRVVLSDALWRSRFAEDTSIVGSTIRLSGEPYEVVGIAPEHLEDPRAGPVDGWVPYDLSRDTFSQNNSLIMYGRLRDGVTPAQAGAELAVLSRTAKQRWPEADASSLVAVALQDDVAAPSRNLLFALALAVGLVLLVACVNVANLNLIRATGRVQEFAIRAALGCGRARLARQLTVESLLLAGVGGAAGLGVAVAGVRALAMLGRDALPRVGAAGFDPVVLLFAAGLTIATALACGVMPALRLLRSSPNHALMAQTRSATATRRQGRLRNGLAAAQLALALGLLAGAGTLSASFYRLMKVDPGFRLDRVLTFDVQLPDVRYDAARRAEFHEELASRLMAIAGVRAAGATSRLPGTGSLNPWPVVIETGPLAGTSVSQPREHRTVSGAFFATLEIPVLAGRTFESRDDTRAPMRAVVSASLAKTAFPGMPFEQVVGQRIGVLSRRNSREIIGVVGDVALDVYGTERAAVYSAHRQYADNRNWSLTQVVAADSAAERLAPQVRAIVASMDPELVVHRPMPLADVVGRGAARERFALVLMAAFAAVSLTLAALGLYGALAYTVRQRTPELGIRIVLGATSSNVRSIVFRQAAVVLASGIVVGTGTALLLGRSLSSLLFQVAPSDPRILGATAAVLIVVGLVAAWIPARRAARVEPKTAMLG